MGNKVACTPRKTDDINHIFTINPENWTQNEVCLWLKYTHDGDLSDLIQPFQKNKISGLTLVQLTNDDLKNNLNISQFGLRDLFVSAKNKILKQYSESLLHPSSAPQNHTISLSDAKRNKLNTTIHLSETAYKKEIEKANIKRKKHHLYYNPFKKSNSSKSKSVKSITKSFTKSNTISGTGTATATSATYSHDNSQSYYQSSSRQPYHQPVSPVSPLSYTIKSSSSTCITPDAFAINMLICGYFNGIKQYNNISGYNNSGLYGYNTPESIINICFKYYYEYDNDIESFAHDLWKTLVIIEIDTIISPNNSESIRGFTGYKLIKHIRKYLKQYSFNKTDNELIVYCSEMIKYEYIRLAGIDNTILNDNDYNNIFVSSNNYLYQFENEKHRLFISLDEPDRGAWSIGTRVEIYSQTLNGWSHGTIVDIKNNLISVTYGANQQQQMKKTVDRYQDDILKSTSSFIYNRKEWKSNDKLQVFSNRHKKWFTGAILDIIYDQKTKSDLFKVTYANDDNKDFIKYIARWSCDIRELQNISPTSTLSLYSTGTNVMVWSNSKQMWIPGIIIELVPDYDVVNVRYGDYEKLMPINSPHIRLCDDNAIKLLQQQQQQHPNRITK